MKPFLTALCLLAVSISVCAQPNPDWHRAIPPFKITGNIYYVGTADLAIYLVHTPQGNIVINTNFEEDVPALKKSIEQLGFKYADTADLLISHAHGDHDGGVGLVQRETHAKLEYFGRTNVDGLLIVRPNDNGPKGAIGLCADSRSLSSRHLELAPAGKNPVTLQPAVVDLDGPPRRTARYR